MAETFLLPLDDSPREFEIDAWVRTPFGIRRMTVPSGEMQYRGGRFFVREMPVVHYWPIGIPTDSQLIDHWAVDTPLLVLTGFLPGFLGRGLRPLVRSALAGALYGGSRFALDPTAERAVEVPKHAATFAVGDALLHGLLRSGRRLGRWMRELPEEAWLP